MKEPEVQDATAAACRYLLVALIQRLEAAQPGLLASLQAGVEGDQQALAPGLASTEVSATFAEALRILRVAQGG